MEASIKNTAVSLGCCHGAGCFAVVVAGLYGAFPEEMLREGDVYIYSTRRSQTPRKGLRSSQKPMGTCWYANNLLGI